MGTVVEFRKAEPRTVKGCGTCRFYQRDSIPTWSVCHAVGGQYAHEVWETCQGSMWLERPSIAARVRIAVAQFWPWGR